MKTPCPVCGEELPKRGRWYTSVRCDGCGKIFDRYVYDALRRLARLEAVAKIEREFFRLHCPALTCWEALDKPWQAVAMTGQRARSANANTRLAAMRALLAAVKKGRAK